MAPGNPTALEKTVIAQAVHQASSADLGAVARELNGHRLLEQRQGKLPVPWTERDVRLVYLQLFEAHCQTRTREALLDGQHLDDATLDEFPYFAKGSDASHEIVTACFSEFYVGVDSSMRNLQVDFEAAVKELKKIENDESSSEEEGEVSDNDEEEGDDAAGAGGSAAVYRPVDQDEDSTSASEDDD